MSLEERRKRLEDRIAIIHGGLTRDNWEELQNLIDELEQVNIQIETEQRKVRKATGESDVGERFEKRTFNTYQRKLFPKAYDAALRFAMNFEKAERGLMLIGSPGTGKTHLAAAITNYLTDKGIAVQFSNVVDLMEDVKDNFGIEDVVKRMTEVPLLILDDLGKEKSTEWSNSVLYRIINGRYENEKLMIITSNESPQVIEQRIGKATMSRIAEMCDGVLMNGADYRRNR